MIGFDIIAIEHHEFDKVKFPVMIMSKDSAIELIKMK